MKLLLIILISLVHLYAQEVLYEETYWKKLLHYKDNQHRVISKEFFLSKKENPSLEEELKATLKSFRGSYGEKIACSFPARYEWLKTKVNLPTYYLSQCQDLQKYYDSFQKDEIYLVYREGIANTFRYSFGHTYLLFKDHTSSYDSAQFIEINPRDGDGDFFKSAYEGISGEYSISYSEPKLFYKKINRDIIDERYLLVSKIDLSKHEIRTLIYHLYELQNSKLIYYFFNGNCTSYLNDLLSLTKESYDKTNFMDFPSDLSKIYQSKISKVGSITFSNYDYPYPYDGFTTQEKKDYLRAIKEYENLDAVKELQSTNINKLTDLKLIDPSTSSLGAYGSKKSHGLIASYTWYDKNIHDRYPGFEQIWKAEFLKLEINIEKDKTRINHFYFADYYTHFFDQGYSMHIHSGVNRENKNYNLHYENEFGLGIPKRHSENFTSYIFLNAGFENLDVYVKPKVSLLYEINSNNSLEFGHYYKFSQDNFFQTEIEYKKKMDNITLIGKYIKNSGDEDNRVSLSLGYSF